MLWIIVRIGCGGVAGTGCLFAIVVGTIGGVLGIHGIGGLGGFWFWGCR